MNSNSPSLSPRLSLNRIPRFPADAEIGGRLNLRGRALAHRLAQVIWLATFLISLGVFLVSIPARYLHLVQVGYEVTGPLLAMGLTPEFIPYYVGTLDAIAFLVFVIVGIVVFWRKPTEWIALFASLVLITSATALVRPADSLKLVDSQYFASVLLVFVLSTTTIIIFSFIFPDGRFTPRWTALIAAAAVLYTAATILQPAFQAPPMPWPPPPLSPIIIFAIAFGVVVQVYRYRRTSNAAQRNQTKWVILGLCLGVIGLLGFLVIIPALIPQVSAPGPLRLTYVLLGIPFFYASVISFPLALGFSILRFRLWDIDLLISRTLVYVLLTAILAGLFAVLETLGKSLFESLTGAESGLTVVLSTLIVAAAFAPVRDALEGILSTRFKEAPNASKQLDAFCERIETRVSPVRPQQITQRLLDEAVSAFRAQGGRALLTGQGPLQVVFLAGDWDECAELSVEYCAGDYSLGEIALGRRLDGHPYTHADRGLLQGTAAMVADAIEQDRQSAL